MRARLRPLAYPADTLFRAILWRAARGRVAAGPFAGLRLAPHPFLPHLLGSYERELHPVIDTLCARRWDTIVNVGGGNGFYIAGLGRRVAGASLVVFELTAEARAVIAATVARNGLADRTTILGAADRTNLEPACAGPGSLLVVMDIEGVEKELADPAVAPSLRRATMLIETHDLLVPGCRAAIESRFGATHRITVIPTRPRTLDDFPAGLAPSLRHWMQRRCVEAVQEWRGGPQDWLLLEPR
jgi:hypothetical protein